MNPAAVICLQLALLCSTFGEICHPDTCACVQEGSQFLVNCSYRNFSDIPADQFPSQTTYLTFSWNTLKQIPAETFLGMRQIKFLSLDHNQLTNLGDGTFKPMSIILFLDLSYNQLENIPPGLSSSLISLNISHNKITSLEVESLIHLQNLEELILRNNWIAKIPAGQLTLSSLHIVDLTHNELALGEDGQLQLFENVYLMNLSSNRILTIDAKSFQDFKNLFHLDLSGNSIETIAFKAFFNLHFLKYLYLQGNRLSDFPLGLPILEVLDVSNNLITSISEENRADVYPSEVLYLSNNPFLCDCNMRWLKEYFDLKENLYRQMGLQAKSYTPSCALPAEVAGETWEFLDSEVFVCASNSKDTPINKKPTAVGMTMSMENIQSDRLTIHWSSSAEGQLTDLLDIVYYEFGKRASTLQLIPNVFRSRGRLTISNLQPRSNYVICAYPANSVTDPTSETTNQYSLACLETQTLRPSWSKFEIALAVIVLSAVILPLVTGSVILFFCLLQSQKCTPAQKSKKTK